MKKARCQTLSKALDLWNATARVAPDLLKVLATLSDTTVRRPAVDREGLKPYSKSGKRPHYSRWPTILLFTNFSKTLLTTERGLTRQWFLAVDLSSTFLNTGTIGEAFQKSGKQNSLRHLLKSSVSM